MTEEAYRQHKEEGGSYGITPDEPSRKKGGAETTIRTQRRRSMRARGTAQVDYSSFKQTLTVAVQDLKLEIQSQHEQTRAEVKMVGRDVLAAVRSSPSEYVKLVCEFGSLFLAFALALRFIFGIELVNTVFAIFMLFSFGVYWAMALLKQHLDKRHSRNSRA